MEYHWKISWEYHWNYHGKIMGNINGNYHCVCIMGKYHTPACYKPQRFWSTPKKEHSQLAKSTKTLATKIHKQWPTPSYQSPNYVKRVTLWPRENYLRPSKSQQISLIDPTTIRRFSGGCLTTGYLPGSPAERSWNFGHPGTDGCGWPRDDELPRPNKMYPLVMADIAAEHGHRNSEISH